MGWSRNEETDVGLTGWQLNGSALQWELVDRPVRRQADDNAFFRGLYRNIAGLLANPVHQLFDFEAREHTAQVEQEDRLEREARFRFTDKDRTEWRAKNGPELEWLPVLFCSPTMELGVDISSLNTVYMRNVPPHRPTTRSAAAVPGGPGSRRSSSPTAPARVRTTSTTSATPCAWCTGRSMRRRSTWPTWNWSRATCMPSGSPRPASAWATACATCWT